MKKNAKLLALLCAAVLLFSGCSSGTAPESTESTTAATTQSAPDQTQAFETPASETQAPAAERDVTVDFVVVGAGAGGLQAATEAPLWEKASSFWKKRSGPAALRHSARAFSGQPAQSSTRKPASVMMCRK